MPETSAQPPPSAPNAAPPAEDDPIADLQDRFGPQLEAAQAQLMEVNERVKDFVRKNPGSTMLGALAIGFLVGKWASRR
jgi:ElaB/YqjD/DUF883 family membrane-anchored ribosome-binding protein